MQPILLSLDNTTYPGAHENTHLCTLVSSKPGEATYTAPEFKWLHLQGAVCVHAHALFCYLRAYAKVKFSPIYDTKLRDWVRRRLVSSAPGTLRTTDITKHPLHKWNHSTEFKKGTQTAHARVHAHTG